jgi:hypothetical protein
MKRKLFVVGACILSLCLNLGTQPLFADVVCPGSVTPRIAGQVNVGVLTNVSWYNTNLSWYTYSPQTLVVTNGSLVVWSNANFLLSDVWISTQTNSAGEPNIVGDMLNWYSGTNSPNYTFSHYFYATNFSSLQSAAFQTNIPSSPNYPVSGNFTVVPVNYRTKVNEAVTTNQSGVLLLVNSAPTIEILSPTNQQIYSELGIVHLEAVASDIDGTVPEGKLTFSLARTGLDGKTNQVGSISANGVPSDLGQLSQTSLWSIVDFAASTTRLTNGIVITNVTERYSVTNCVESVLLTSRTSRSWDLTNSQAGSYVLTVTATDDLGTTTVQERRFQVVPQPTVRFGAPTENARFLSNSNITLQVTNTLDQRARIENPDAPAWGITNLVLWSTNSIPGNPNLDGSISNPSTIAETNFAPNAVGDYTFFAQATDSFGFTNIPTRVNIRFTQAPSIRITSPPGVSETNFIVINTSTKLTALVEVDKSAKSVVFLAAPESASSGTNFVALTPAGSVTANSTNFLSSLDHTFTNQGYYQLKASLTDTNGFKAESTPIRLRVVRPPTLVLRTGDGRASYLTNSTFDVVADAEAYDDATLTSLYLPVSETNSIVSVTNKLSTRITRSYASNGSVQIDATVEDSRKLTASITLQLNIVESPKVSLALTQAGTANTNYFLDESPIRFTANAGLVSGQTLDPNKSGVSIYRGNTLVTNLTVSGTTPFTASNLLSANLDGSAYSAQAYAVDTNGYSGGYTGLSQLYPFNVVKRPTVTIDRPTENEPFLKDQSVTLAVTAVPGPGSSSSSITKVTLEAGAGASGPYTPLVITNSSAFNFDWLGAPVGTNRIRAIATDAYGFTNLPVVRSVRVITPPTIRGPAQGPIAGFAGEVVTFQPTFQGTTINGEQTTVVIQTAKVNGADVGQIAVVGTSVFLPPQATPGTHPLLLSGTFIVGGKTLNVESEGLQMVIQSRSLGLSATKDPDGTIQVIGDLSTNKTYPIYSSPSLPGPWTVYTNLPPGTELPRYTFRAPYTNSPSQFFSLLPSAVSVRSEQLNTVVNDQGRTLFGKRADISVVVSAPSAITNLYQNDTPEKVFVRFNSPTQTEALQAPLSGSVFSRSLNIPKESIGTTNIKATADLLYQRADYKILGPTSVVTNTVLEVVKSGEALIELATFADGSITNALSGTKNLDLTVGLDTPQDLTNVTYTFQSSGLTAFRSGVTSSLYSVTATNPAPAFATTISNATGVFLVSGLGNNSKGERVYMNQVAFAATNNGLRQIPPVTEADVSGPRMFPTISSAGTSALTVQLPDTFGKNPPNITGAANIVGMLKPPYTLTFTGSGGVYVYNQKRPGANIDLRLYPQLYHNGVLSPITTNQLSAVTDSTRAKFDFSISGLSLKSGDQVAVVFYLIPIVQDASKLTRGQGIPGSIEARVEAVTPLFTVP